MTDYYTEAFDFPDPIDSIVEPMDDYEKRSECADIDPMDAYHEELETACLIKDELIVDK